MYGTPHTYHNNNANRESREMNTLPAKQTVIPTRGINVDEIMCASGVGPTLMLKRDAQQIGYSHVGSFFVERSDTNFDIYCYDARNGEIFDIDPVSLSKSEFDALPADNAERNYAALELLGWDMEL